MFWLLSVMTSRQHSSPLQRNSSQNCSEHAGIVRPMSTCSDKDRLLGNYPSFYRYRFLAFQNKGELSFLTVEEWKSRADMTPPLQLSEQQSALINTIRHEIRGTSSEAHSLDR